MLFKVKDQQEIATLCMGFPSFHLHECSSGISHNCSSFWDSVVLIILNWFCAYFGRLGVFKLGFFFLLISKSPDLFASNCCWKLLLLPHVFIYMVAGDDFVKGFSLILSLIYLEEPNEKHNVFGNPPIKVVFSNNLSKLVEL